MNTTATKKQPTTQELTPKIVEILKKKREEKEIELKRVGQTKVFCLIDKNRRNAYVKDIIYPEVSFYIPEEDAVTDLDGEKVFGSVTMRYIKGERSLFKHKQSKDGFVITPIEITSGVIVLNEKTDKALIEFFSLHPKNRDSKFKQSDIEPAWYMEDTGRTIEEEIKRNELIYSLHEQIMTLTNEELTKIAVAFDLESFDNAKHTKVILKELAEKNPEKAKAMLNDPQLEIKATYKLALILNILKNDGKKLSWGDTNGFIISIPKGKDQHDFCIDFFTTDDGVVVMDKVRKIIYGN